MTDGNKSYGGDHFVIYRNIKSLCVTHASVMAGGDGGSYHGASALKTKNTLGVSETYLGVVQSLSCV